MQYTRLNKQSFLREQSMIILTFISMWVQYFYMLGYADQGMLYQLIAPAEWCIYVFNGFVCIYGFWRIAGRSRIGDIFVSIIASTAYSVHSLLYHTVIRICATESDPGTIEKLIVLIVDKANTEFDLSGVKYIVAFVLVFAICIFIAIATPNKIRHKCHVMKIKYQKYKDYTSRELKNINKRICILERSENHITLPEKLDDDSCCNTEYNVYFETRNRNSGSVYIVFSDYEMNDEGRFVFFVAEYDKSKKQLLPVDSQDDFDKIENILTNPPF